MFTIKKYYDLFEKIFIWEIIVKNCVFWYIQTIGDEKLSFHTMPNIFSKNKIFEQNLDIYQIGVREPYPSSNYSDAAQNL